MQNGIVSLPVIGAGVWLEFEQGNPDHPVWTGCYYRNAGEAPALAKLIPPGTPGMTLQTPLHERDGHQRRAPGRAAAFF